MTTKSVIFYLRVTPNGDRELPADMTMMGGPVYTRVPVVQGGASFWIRTQVFDGDVEEALAAATPGAHEAVLNTEPLYTKEIVRRLT